MDTTDLQALMDRNLDPQYWIVGCDLAKNNSPYSPSPVWMLLATENSL